MSLENQQNGIETEFCKYPEILRPNFCGSHKNVYYHDLYFIACRYDFEINDNLNHYELNMYVMSVYFLPIIIKSLLLV